MKQYTREMFQEETLKLTAYDKEKADKIKEGFGVSFDLPSSLVTRLSGWSKDDTVRVTPRAVFSFSSDHGIEEEGGLTDGFSLTTADMLRSLSKGTSELNILGQKTDTQVIPINLGTKGIEEALPGVVHAPVMAFGSLNFAHEDALTEASMMTAVRLGIEFSSEAASRGFRLLIAACNSSSVDLAAVSIIAALTGRQAEDLLERGPDIADGLFQRQLEVIAQAFAARAPYEEDAFDILKKFGGPDLAAMVGFYAGAAIYGVPILLDDRASLAAALLIRRLLPETRELFFASHTRTDPASDRVLFELGITPVIEAPIRQEAGIGALFALPVFDLATALFEA